MYDLIVIGGGPGGSTVASYVARQGFKVLIIEKEEFPRFKIGESLLPYSMGIFEELGFDKVLAQGKYIQKNGALFIDTDSSEQIYFDFTDNGKAKFPFSYEVERDVFDKDYLEFAISLGVTVVQPEKFVNCDITKDKVTVETDKSKYEGKFIIDASGASSVITNKFGKKESNEFYNNNFAIYAHFSNVTRDFQKDAGDITIGILKNKTWSWIIPFIGNKTSVGLVVSKQDLNSINNKQEFFDHKVKENPWLETILKTGTQLGELKVASNFSRKPNTFVGERWASVGDAASFLDPVFSSGVHMAISSGKFISDNIIYSLKNDGVALNSYSNVNDYDKVLRLGMSRFHNLLQIFYSGDFISRVKALEGRKRTMSMMVQAVAGGMWEEDNTMFRTGML